MSELYPNRPLLIYLPYMYELSVPPNSLPLSVKLFNPGLLSPTELLSKTRIAKKHNQKNLYHHSDKFLFTPKQAKICLQELLATPNTKHTLKTEAFLALQKTLTSASAFEKKQNLDKQEKKELNKFSKIIDAYCYDKNNRFLKNTTTENTLPAEAIAGQAQKLLLLAYAFETQQFELNELEKKLSEKEQSLKNNLGQDNLELIDLSEKKQIMQNNTESIELEEAVRLEQEKITQSKIKANANSNIQLQELTKVPFLSILAAMLNFLPEQTVFYTDQEHIVQELLTLNEQGLKLNFAPLNKEEQKEIFSYDSDSKIELYRVILPGQKIRESVSSSILNVKNMTENITLIIHSKNNNQINLAI